MSEKTICQPILAPTILTPGRHLRSTLSLVATVAKSQKMSVDFEEFSFTCGHSKEWSENALPGTRPTILVLSGITIPIAEYAVLEEGVAIPSSESILSTNPEKDMDSLSRTNHILLYR